MDVCQTIHAPLPKTCHSPPQPTFNLLSLNKIRHLPNLSSNSIHRTADFADLGKLKACFRTQDCQYVLTPWRPRPIRPIGPTASPSGTFQETPETQGMGTLERPEGPNGEVPSPLRSFVSSWKRVSKLPFLLLFYGHAAGEPWLDCALRKQVVSLKIRTFHDQATCLARCAGIGAPLSRIWSGQS